MPKLGLGTYQMSPDDSQKAIPAAINTGYRLIDTATVYRNEEAIGESILGLIKDKVVKREELFIVSKLATFDHGYEETLRAVHTSLNKLKVDYLDMYLIHWPAGNKKAPSSEQNYELRKASWKALEKLYFEGKLRAIGVSNYMVRHLEEMKEYAAVMPMVNQFELHPLYHLIPLVKWCRDNNVIIQAYSSLARGVLLEPSSLQDYPILRSAANRSNKTVSQVLLRWAWQHDYCIIPKSVKEQRIKENADLDFELTEQEMKCIDELNVHSKKVCWDPETVY